MSGAVSGRGAAGPQGPAGPEGPAGPVGPAGPQGPQGVQGPVGQAGPQGPAGADGQSQYIGQPAATTLQPGSPATISVAGDGSAASPYVYTFGIPAGRAGDQGALPVLGSPVAVESQQASASWTGTGSDADPAILHLGLPQGPQGPQGGQGPVGPEGPQGPKGDSYLSVVAVTGLAFDVPVNARIVIPEFTTQQSGSSATLWATESIDWFSSYDGAITVNGSGESLRWQGRELASCVTSEASVTPHSRATKGATSTSHQVSGTRSITMTIRASIDAGLLAPLAGSTLSLTVMYPSRPMLYTNNDLRWASSSTSGPIGTAVTQLVGQIQSDGSWSATASVSVTARSITYGITYNDVSNVKGIVTAGSFS